LLTVHLSIFISVINQLDAQNFCFTISLFHASTCFEHYVLIKTRWKLHYTASGIITPIGGRLVHRLREDVLSQPVHQTATYRCDDTRGCVMQFWPADDEYMCSKHVEAWNKLIVKQKFCASSWLITRINPLPEFILIHQQLTNWPEFILIHQQLTNYLKYKQLRAERRFRFNKLKFHQLAKINPYFVKPKALRLCAQE